MHGTELPPRSDFDHDPDEFRLTLERNALARWWRDQAGARGETGARQIARDIPSVRTDDSSPAPGDD